MHFESTVSVDVERVSGKFAAKDELSDKIIEELDGSNPGAVFSDEDAEYEITDWAIEDSTPVKRRKVSGMMSHTPRYSPKLHQSGDYGIWDSRRAAFTGDSWTGQRHSFPILSEAHAAADALNDSRALAGAL